MSWQAYVDNNLVGSGKISKAAIIGQKGGVWASSAGYTLSPDEQNTIIQAFRDPSAIQTNGFRLAGAKFIVTNAGPEIIQGKMQLNGVVLAKTKQAILVAEYVAPIQAQEVTILVTSVQAYLQSVGY